MSSPGEVVVTGWGSVGPHAPGRAGLALALASGEANIETVEPTREHARHAARLLAGADTSAQTEWVPEPGARRMGRPSLFALAAARMALEQATGERRCPEDACVAVHLATAFGAVDLTEQLLRQLFERGPDKVSPFAFMECVANAPAGQVAIGTGARGGNVTICQREAGPLLAVARAARALRAGRCGMALAGAVDEASPLMHAILGRFRYLARAEESHTEAARPFGTQRDGVLLAEGAAVLVLETASNVAARGGRPLALVPAVVSAHDPTAGRVGWGERPDLLAAAARRGLERQGVAPGSIDVVVSGASGSIGGDRLEAAVLSELFGNGLPPVVAPKGIVGESGGGLLGSAMVVLDGGAVLSPLADDELDATAAEPGECTGLGVTLHRGAFGAPPQRVLVTGLAMGGAAAWVVLQRP